MKLRTVPAMVGAAVVAASFLIGMTPGVASADSELCINPAIGSPYCALDPTDIGATSQYGVIMAQGIGSDWVYPTTSYTNSYSVSASNTNYIAEAATGDCLQLDVAGGYVVKLAACVGDKAEDWTNYYNPYTGRTEFVSSYYLNSNNDSLCLSFDQSGTDVPGSRNGDILRADPCLPGGGTNYWYQQWGTS